MQLRKVLPLYDSYVITCHVVRCLCVYRHEVYVYLHTYILYMYTCIGLCAVNAWGLYICMLPTYVYIYVCIRLCAVNAWGIHMYALGYVL